MPKAKIPVRKRRLKNLNDCVRAGAWLFNAIACEEIKIDIGGKLTYLLNVQKGILLSIEQLEIERKQVIDFEERLKKIEAELKNQNEKN